jgi:alpha-1,4-digalacturonate transport system substrate-binding protein
MQLKKRGKLLTLAVSALFVLSACAPGGAPEQAGSTNTEPPQQQEVDAKSFAGEKMNYVYFSDGDADLKATESLVAQFEAETEVSVNLQVVPFADLEQLLQARLTGNDIPHVSRMAMLMVPTFADELLDMRTYYGEAYKSEFIDGPLAVVLGKNGEMLGVPTDITMNGLIVNKSMFDVAGVTIPTTPWSWDEMLAAAEAVQKANGTSHSFIMDRSGHRLSTILSQFDTFLIGADGGNGLNRSNTIDAFNMLVDLASDDRLSKDFFLEGGPTYAGGLDLFLAEEVPVYLGGNWLVGNLEANAPFEWAVAPNACKINCGGFPGGKVTSAFKRSDNPELGAFFLNWLASAEQQSYIDSKANWLPTRVDLSESGIDYELRSDAMNVFVADIARTPTVAYASTYSTIFGLAATALVDNLQRAVGGVLSVEDAVDKLIAEVDALVAEQG